MVLLRWLVARFLLNRLFGGGRSRRRGYGGWGGYPRRQRGRAGLFGPFPYYTTRTRRGSSVTVGGCCLPLALGLVSVPVAAARLLWRRAR